ncbi:MAG: hypothetical protein Sapg2KO_53200 [Saprospiraceae bacterium]
MKASPTLVLLICIVFTTSLWSQDKTAQIDQIIKSYLKPSGPGMAVMATKGDQVVYKKAFGQADLQHSKTLRVDQQFRIGSVTKQFTAIAILKLAHEKQLNLEDSIEKYIPEFSSKKEITIKHLLNHTSGLGNQADIPSFEIEDINGDYPKVKMPQIIEAALKFTPGTQYAYSNLGYIVLGYVIEQVSGMSYEAYLNKHFFEALNMENTGFEYLHDFTASMSKGYSFTGKDYTEAESINMEIPYAAGGIVSNLEDLAIWNQSVMKGAVVPMEFVHQLAKANILPHGQATEYSMGWRVGTIQGIQSLKHDGIINGFTSMTIYLPETDVFVVALSNCDQNRNIENPTSKIAAILIDRPFPSKAIELPKETLATYQGQYKNGDHKMNIVLHNDQLVYYQSGSTKARLTPTGKHHFLLEGSLNQLLFDINDETISYNLTSLSPTKTWKKTAPLAAFNSLPLEEQALNEFVGKYQIQNQFVFEVIRKGDKMFGQIGNDRKEIICYDSDTFCSLEMDATIRFKRDEAGLISKVTVKQGVGEFSGTKMD